MSYTLISRLLLFAVIAFFLGCKNSSSGPANTDALLLGFSVSEYPSLDLSIDDSEKLAFVSGGTPLDGSDNMTALTAEFLLSEGATAYVNDVPQESGKTTNNYQEGLFFTVISEDSLTINTYFIYLTENLPTAFLVDGNIDVVANPSGNAPLSALATFSTRFPAEVRVFVDGEEEVEHTFFGQETSHSVPIHGLYPNTNNEVLIEIIKSSRLSVTETITIQTDPIPDFFPDIEINVLNESMMEPGMHYQSISIGNAGAFNTFPVIYDNNGDIRWYLDLAEYSQIVWPVQFGLKDEKQFIFTGVRDAVLEFDMFGKEVRRFTVPGYRIHHEVIQLPNGNYVAAVNKDGATILKGGETLETVEDHIIEIDGTTGEIVTEWDLRQVLDVSRIDVVNGFHDWLHMNAIWYDNSDQSLVISGRNQGVVKLNWENELQWILAPHQGWEAAGPEGNGFDTREFLLTAVDNSGTPFHGDIQSGVQESNNFSWTWGQHAPMILPNGNLFVFDNGTNRNFGNAASYSQMNEYVIDQENLTAQMVWSYGKERGVDTRSDIISDVDLMEETGNRLFAPGYITGDGARAKLVEVTYPDAQVVFESTLYFKNQLSEGTPGWGNIDIVYRGERAFIYGNIEIIMNEPSRRRAEWLSAF